MEQQQISRRLGKIESFHENTTSSPRSPLSQIDKEFTVTLRMN
jgi:hypothetical protein